MPEVRLSLPAMILIGLVIIGLAAALIFTIINGQRAEATGLPLEEAQTPTLTPTISVTPTASPTLTPLPTWTPLPPIEYQVKDNETCLVIALQFNSSVTNIILENNLDANCTINPGMMLRVPQPTLTPSPQPTATVEVVNDEDSCDNTVSVTVESGSTLGTIAATYNVTMSDIMAYNHMTTDVVRAGTVIIVPLCDRLPTAGPTPTATPAPPYPAPNLLLPRSGAAFTASDEAVTLQWASVADLRSNELYRVTVQDLTSSEERILVEYVSDTKYILPATLRPLEASPHIFQWSVTVARMINNDPTNPIYEVAGQVSAFRVFSWNGSGIQPTAAP